LKKVAHDRWSRFQIGNSLTTTLSSRVWPDDDDESSDVDDDVDDVGIACAWAPTALPHPLHTPSSTNSWWYWRSWLTNKEHISCPSDEDEEDDDEVDGETDPGDTEVDDERVGEAARDDGDDEDDKDDEVDDAVFEAVLAAIIEADDEDEEDKGVDEGFALRVLMVRLLVMRRQYSSQVQRR
jgi:hypothetical protein